MGDKYTHISVTKPVRKELQERCMDRDLTYSELLRRDLLDDDGTDH